MPAADPDDLGNAATDEALRLLNQLRLATIGSILSAPEPLSGTLRGLLAEIDGLIATWNRETSAAMARHIEQAANAGDESVLDDMRRARLEVPLSYVGVSEQLVRTAAAYVADLVTGLSADARQAITRDVRLAALGGVPTMDLIDRIGRSLFDPSTFATLAARAEAIARTEVSRVFNMAAAAQAAEAAARYPQMRKVWEHSSSSPGFTSFQRKKSRPNHIAAWQATSANPIPIDQDFDLGNETAPYPHWPGLSAKNSVNCRCRVRLVAPEVA